MTRVPDTHVRVLAELLSSLLDYMPGPAVDRRNPLSCRQPTAGSAWAPSGYELCPDCDLDGTVKRGKHRVTCPRCKGKGCWAVDRYDRQGRHVDTSDDVDLCDPHLPPKVRRAAIVQALVSLADYTGPELDRASARADLALERMVGVGDEDPMWLTLQKQARYRTEQPWAVQILDAARLLPPQYRLALRLGLMDAIGSPVDPMLVEVGLTMLAEYLPAGFRAPSAVVEKVTAELAVEQAKSATVAGRWADPEHRAARNREVLRLYHLGWSSRAIGKRLGVGKDTIRRVLDARDQQAA